jgi:hypothetical protein
MIKRPRLLVSGAVALLGIGLLIYSQTKAFAWDEGWHLLAAQSILLRGKKLYLDFVYSQTPLNAYWNAGWMRIFGDTWRTAHAVAAVMTTLAVLLVAHYLLRRFPVPGWRLPIAITGIFIVGLNAMVFEFGTVGQAYALCLFSIVAAFRLTVAAVERDRLLLAAGAGFLASTAANASLLTAPVAPLLLVWMMLYNQVGNRWAKLAAYLAGALIPCGPLVRLFILSPRHTIFCVLDYNMKYRYLSWDGALAHDIGVMLSWIDQSQALALILLGGFGLLFVMRQSGWKRAVRAEFYLCAWLAAALALHISRAHPHFQRYYLFTVPFLAILACAGLYAAGSRMAAPDRPFWPVFVLCLLAVLGLGKSFYDNREDYVWKSAEEIGRKIDEVTPPNGVLAADELTYFVTRRTPPPGLELADQHKFNLAPQVMAEMHLISQVELDRRMKTGYFDTIETWEEADKIQELGLAKIYKHHVVVREANIFWGK